MLQFDMQHAYVSQTLDIVVTLETTFESICITMSRVPIERG